MKTILAALGGMFVVAITIALTVAVMHHGQPAQQHVGGNCNTNPSLCGGVKQPMKAPAPQPKPHITCWMQTTNQGTGWGTLQVVKVCEPVP